MLEPAIANSFCCHKDLTFCLLVLTTCPFLGGKAAALICPYLVPGNKDAWFLLR